MRSVAFSTIPHDPTIFPERSAGQVGIIPAWSPDRVMGDAFYLAAGRGLASTFFKSFADQFESAYNVFGDRNECVQATLLNAVPQDVLDEVRNAFDGLAYDFTQRLATMAGENDDEPGEDACCDGRCDGTSANSIADEIASLPGVDELRPVPAEAAAE